MSNKPPRKISSKKNIMSALILVVWPLQAYYLEVLSEDGV